MPNVDVFGRQFKKIDPSVKLLSNGGLNSINDSLSVKVDPNINNILSLSANGVMVNGIKSTGGVMTGNLNMENNKISDLSDPIQDGDASNKKFVKAEIKSESIVTKLYINTLLDTKLDKSESISFKSYIDNLIYKITVKNKVGYIPILNSNADSKYGFKVNTSSENSNIHKNAFNVFSYENTEWITYGINKDFWIQIYCPESVKIYRFALRGKNSGTDLIYKWKLQGSNNVYANRWDTLYNAENDPVNKVMRYYYIQPNEGYTTYRIFVHEAEGETPGLSYWQLYTLDNIVPQQ